jgi:UDP-N-acetylenolpyruvoylglucosamine reductase
MNLDAAREALRTLCGVAVRVDEPASRHGNLRVGGEVDLYVVVRDEAALAAAVAVLRREGVRWRACHGFTDVPVCDAAPPAVIRLGPEFGLVEVRPDGVRAGVEAPLARVGRVAREAGHVPLAPLEHAAGTLGAWIAEAGQEALAPPLASVRVLQGRGYREVDPRAPLPSTALPVAATLAGPLPRRLPLPPEPGAISATRGVPECLRRSGLVGLRLRGLRVEAPATVVNLGGATGRDLDLVVRLLQERLLRDHGLDLEPRFGPRAPARSGRAP